MANRQAGAAGNAFETTDPELIVHLLRGSYGDGTRIIPRGRPGWMRADQAPLSPAVRFDHLSCACSFEAQVAPPGVLLIFHVRAGRISHDHSGNERRYGPGDVCLATQPGQRYTARCADGHIAAAAISQAVLGQVAGPASGRSREPVRLTGFQPASAIAARHWTTTYAYVRDEILPIPEAAAQPLLIAAAEQLLAAALLAAFPNNAVTDPTIEDRHDAHPAALRRAAAFIEENAHRAITIADIASAASVTARAVQLAFRRHLDTTPLAYLRRVRLERAHRDLRAADPARGTVTTVAYRWGYPSASRFAAEYRAAYGVLPSRTLRG
jgi:AraC-like DNA-binding protein